MSGRSPIIIIGMHRSGTSMITRMLEELGLFVGKKKEENHESPFFLRINDWLLSQSGGSWDNPEPIYHLLENKEVRMLAIDYIQYLMKTPHVVSYLGWSKYLRYCTPVNLDILWGWKDPRNTFTLPIWLDIFPNVKVIHICRHGVDVANSLKVRHDKRLEFLNTFKTVKKLISCLRQEKPYLTPRCASLDGGFSLWEEYMRCATNNVKNLKNQVIEVKYEDFLSNPYMWLERLTDLCELSVSVSDLRSVAEGVRKDRAFAYLKDEQLSCFADKISDRLKIMGY